MSRFLDADDAARTLGVSTSTLYAYVSRGLLRSQPIPGSRKKNYLAADVRRLQERKRMRRDPTRAARAALHWGGSPVLESSLTMIAGGRLYYRGRDACRWAREATLLETAELLWGAPVQELDAQRETRGWERATRRWKGLPAAEAFHVYLASAAAADAAAFDLRAEGVRRAGARILRGMAAVAAGAAPSDKPIARQLRRGWGVRRKAGEEMIRTALVLCADHELNASTFTARCVASAGSSPYAAATAALGALEGFKHGGHSDRVGELFDEVERGRDPEAALADRLRQGQPIPGFRQPLYPDGDPRVVPMLELCRTLGARSAGLRTAERILVAAESVLGDAPNLDFGLVSIARTLGLRGREPFLMFAVGRTVGWIAHALEQYESGRLIRPRASYVGPDPDSEGGG
ncbi:MAG: citrate synthase family protein [Planctomycetota bacterium]|jgi:citrate synthase